MAKGTPSYDDYVRGIDKLNPQEQLSLLEIISARLKNRLNIKERKHSLLELEGLGKEIWDGIDPQKYIRQERETGD
jgi:hypothetical protein